ncbi:hypothetical protein LSTR_LSTR005249 [Laodelphax striatellus]|uniref:UPAR/Ly6 domain-containing protein n=1 Tax=Laodelphax striatellus TaxID=195883 RepID=A0A482X7V7_LAOST|nr:hypothetical protein LSTR_LSTR005249 [Laodelphax striatellus]
MEGSRVSSSLKIYNSSWILVAFIIFSAVVPTLTLRCYQCGQYNDGVGSITPCINYTERLHLKDCPTKLSQNCIKYVSEGSTVRDCAAECVEKGEAWGTKIYCCREDGCNRGASHQSVHVWTVLALPLITLSVTSLMTSQRRLN